MTNQKIIERAIALFGNERFGNEEDIRSFMQKYTGNGDFIAWFNEKIARKKYFAKGAEKLIGKTKARSDFYIPEGQEENFSNTWRYVPEYLEAEPGKGINLFQFLGLSCIIINEHRGHFIPSSEGNKKPANEQLAYCMKLYNKKKNAQRSAWDLFQDSTFLNRHPDFEDERSLALTPDKRWDSLSYPDDYPREPEHAKMIAEADFFKFRGRGFIQTTWRGNYKSVIGKILDYDGKNRMIRNFRDYWSDEFGGDRETIATCSANADWDELFMNTGNEIACIAVKIYNDSHNGCFQNKIANAAHLLGTAHGSFYHTGTAVAGSNANGYGDLVRGRMVQIIEQMVNDADA